LTEAVRHQDGSLGREKLKDGGVNHVLEEDWGFYLFVA
jgi:hypothetical protein